MTAFEDFVTAELPQRPVLLTTGNTSYDGDPNDGGAPAKVSGAPKGTFYLRDGTAALYQKKLATSGSYVIVGEVAGALDFTEGDFTITVDPISGTDPVVPLRIKNQAQATAAGSFKTIPAAVDSLPDKLHHEATFSIVDGSHTMTVDFIGRFARFSYELTPGVGQLTAEFGRIRLTSANRLIIAPTTSSMAVSSSTGNIVTLQSDPLLTADLYRNYMLVVTGGLGSGQIFPIRTHSGTSFEVSFDLTTALDNTSTVEIRSAAAQLVIPAGHYPGWRMQMGANVTLPFPALIFDAIDLVAATSSQIFPLASSFAIEGGSRFLGIGISLYNSGININTCSIDGRGQVTALLLTAGFSRIRNNGYPWLARGATGIPFRIFGGGNNAEGSAQAQMYGGTIDGSGFAAIEVNGLSAGLAVKINIIRGTGHTYAFRARNGAMVSMSKADALDANYISGSTNDIILGDTGGVGVSYTEIDADPNDIIIGPDGSKAVLQT